MWCSFRPAQGLIRSNSTQWLHTPVQHLVLLAPYPGVHICATSLCTLYDHGSSTVACSSSDTPPTRKRRKRRFEFFKRTNKQTPRQPETITGQEPPGTAARPLQAKAPDEATSDETPPASTPEGWELVQVAPRTKPAKPRSVSVAAARYAHAVAESRAATNAHAEVENGVRPVRAAPLSGPVWLVLAVAVVLVDKQRRVLVARRAAHKHWGGMWEFPGGKVEMRETPEAAAAREMREEVGVIIDPRNLIPLTFASEAASNRGKTHLLLPLYMCTEWMGEPWGCEGQAVQWTAVEELRGLPMPPIDKKFLVAVHSAIELLHDDNDDVDV